MNKLAQEIASALFAHAKRRRLSIGLIYTGNRAVAERLIASGHRLIVVSDRFHSLLKLFEKMRQEEGRTPDERVVMVESHLGALPYGLETLDALVLSSGLPLASMPLHTLLDLSAFIKPNGLLVWPQPVKGGIRGGIARLGSFRRGPLGLARRETLCRLAMEAGFYEVGQTLVAKSVPPIAITTGRRRGLSGLF